MRVRLIERGDIEEMIDLVRDMVAESPAYVGVPFSDAAVRGWFVAAVEAPKEYFCAVAEEAGKLIGFMIALAAPMIFSTDKAAYEMGLYVIPRYRGTRAAWKLYTNFESWARSVSCRFSISGVSTGVDTAIRSRFYERLGYSHAGPSFRKELV